MAEHILRDIGNRHEFVVVQQAVPAKPRASRHRSSNKTEGLGTTRKKKNLLEPSDNPVSEEQHTSTAVLVSSVLGRMCPFRTSPHETT